MSADVHDARLGLCLSWRLSPVPVPAEAAHTSAPCDGRLAGSDAGCMEQLANSRDAIERSRALLKKLRERDGDEPPELAALSSAGD
jgi:hypothetical protein